MTEEQENIYQIVANHAVNARLAIQRAQALLRMAVIDPVRMPPKEAVNKALDELDTVEEITLSLRSIKELEPPPPEVPVCDLSKREIEIIQALANNETAQETALRLYITANTVKSHRNNIYEKLSVNSGAAAVAAAMRMGVVS